MSRKIKADQRLDDSKTRHVGRSAVIWWAGCGEASQASTAFARTCEGDVSNWVVYSSMLGMLSVCLHPGLWHSCVDRWMFLNAQVFFCDAPTRSQLCDRCLLPLIEHDFSIGNLAFVLNPTTSFHLVMEKMLSCFEVAGVALTALLLAGKRPCDCEGLFLFFPSPYISSDVVKSQYYHLVR